MPDHEETGSDIPATKEKDRVLLVDDEPHILSSFERELGESYTLETANSGAEALERISTDGPYAVVISDQKMPEMDGIEFLSRVREIAPDTVRIMLTGHADLDTAIEAVNSGYIFRFLTKPCPSETLATVVDAGINQYKLILAERELHTLMKLKKAMDGIILGFSTLLEARDPYTAGHQRRVANLAMAIGDSMGLDEDRIAAIRLSALVHDIGKIYVPADFLNKPGKLTDIEYSILWTHPQVGHDILQSVDFVWPISDIVWQHHEKMDGSGYPRGLSGENILLEARILSVSDVIEAMASHRPYRASLGIELALEEIEAKRGTHFDPIVVDTCLKLFREEGFQLFE